MNRPLLNRLATVRQGAFLPHWTMRDAIYHVVFRLADSLPASVVDDYRTEREALLAEAGDNIQPAVQDRLRELFSSRVESYLDQGLGECWLRQVEIANLVAASLAHFEGSRYQLHAWCVMPNHVHAVVQPLGTHELSEILHSWKSFTANEANRVLGRTGPFWQKESYDHIVRDEYDFDRTIRYVQDNPVKAGLKDWSWVSSGNST